MYYKNASITQDIENLYNEDTNAALFNDSTGNWYITTVGDRQRCLLSPTLLNTSVERIMSGTLSDHKERVNNCHWRMDNHQFPLCR